MNENKICYIFGAGIHYTAPPVMGKGSFVIAADGGLKYLENYGIVPNLVVGDFDSLQEPPQSICFETIKLPQEKDDTDMAEALQQGWLRGLRTFYIYGGTGGRLDHTLANIQCVADLACRGGRGYLFDRDTVITAICETSITFPAGMEGVVSVFSHSDISVGVCEKGLKYPLENAVLKNTQPLGVSNEFTREPGSISVEAGTLIVIYPAGVTPGV